MGTGIFPSISGKIPVSPVFFASPTYPPIPAEPDFPLIVWARGLSQRSATASSARPAMGKVNLRGPVLGCSPPIPTLTFPCPRPFRLWREGLFGCGAIAIRLVTRKRIKGDWVNSLPDNEIKGRAPRILTAKSTLNQQNTLLGPRGP